MAAHADVLDRPEPLTKPIWVSVTLHILVVGSFTAAYVIQPHRLMIGDAHGGGMGAFMVNPVNTIPLPNQGGRENPVANDTKSQVPTPPTPKEKPKPIPKVKAPPLDAVALPSKHAPVKHQQEAERQPPPQPNRYRDQQQYNPNQLYSDSGQRASSQMYQLPGGGGVGLGNNSPFGEEFGAYANAIRNSIAQNWNPVKAGSSLSVVVTFTIQRDGSVTNVRVATASGNPSLDLSAQRAVLDAQLPKLPDRFPSNHADVELRFVVGN